MNRVKGLNRIKYAILLAIMLFLVGCTGSVKNMQVAPTGTVNTVPKKGKSTVVFLRPSSLGFAVQSSVFEIKDNTAHLVGIVAAKKKVVHEVNPGKHLFMVVGESGDFMSADLLPNKTYYALVTPRIGLWKARFSLKAVHQSEMNSAEFNEWLNECQWVRKNSASVAWANQNKQSIQSKFTEYYSDWVSKPSDKQPHLLAQDGK